MEIKHKELLPGEDQPFLHCKLDRQKYANNLTTIVESYADGFVLALNGEWGTGKTTFVKMWQASLKYSNYKTIYFNAWENDFENEPLIALLGELKKLIHNENDNVAFKSLLEKGAVITRNILPALAKGLLSKYFNAEIVLNVIEKSIEAATEILDKTVEEYVRKKEGLIDFKKELESYIELYSNGKPVVFIIDELDRCRPDYAVEILEKVKHFFSVKGIVFVLSIDKIQLGHSIQGYYGSPKIDADEYLRRFIDIEFCLPDPDTNSFTKYLFEYYEFKDFFHSPERGRHTELRGDTMTFISFAARLFEDQRYTLRQQEKLFAQARLIIRSFTSKSNIFPTLFFVLIHIKTFEIEFYNCIKNKKITIQELVDKFEKIFRIEYLTSHNDEFVRHLCSAEALLIKFYNNYNKKMYSDSKELIVKVGETEELTFKTKTIGLTNDNILLNFLNYFNRYEVVDIKIDYLLNKIDLLENIS